MAPPRVKTFVYVLPWSSQYPSWIWTQEAMPSSLLSTTLLQSGLDRCEPFRIHCLRWSECLLSSTGLGVVGRRGSSAVVTGKILNEGVEFLPVKHDLHVNLLLEVNAVAAIKCSVFGKPKLQRSPSLKRQSSQSTFDSSTAEILKAGLFV